MGETEVNSTADDLKAEIDARADSGQLLSIPRALPANIRRQATASIRGTVYQAWCSIDAWLRLSNSSTAIYLEGAEDFELVNETDCIAVQVRNTRKSISLGTEKALKALEEFWNVRTAEQTRTVQFHYLTTSSVVVEADAIFGGLAGIDAWRIAKTDIDMAARITTYLVGKLDSHSQLRSFLASCAAHSAQVQLIQQFHWFVDHPNLDAVKRSVDDRIVELLASNNRALNLVKVVRVALEARFWEVVTNPDASKRILSRSDLLQQFADATHWHVPIPLELLASFVTGTYPGLGLLDLILQKVPQPPAPLLDRQKLRDDLCQIVQQRRVALVTGTVHKGKSTLAQLAAAALCPEAWWIVLTSRQPSETDNLLLALARRIDDGSAPSLLIIDDLDISQAAYRAYQRSLQLVLHRACASGRGVIITAQGGGENSGVAKEQPLVEVLVVSALSSEEIVDHCRSNGCPQTDAQRWALFVELSTAGHPKLAQVRITELKQRNWPRPDVADLMGKSPAVQSVRQMARELLAQTVAAPVAELVYALGESTIPVHRDVVIRVAESLQVVNGGDAIAALAGRWLEGIGESHMRTTALLQGAGPDVWSLERRKTIHLNLHDALAAQARVSPAEAAATLWHAYIGGDPRRIGISAMRLHLIADDEAVRQVNHSLQWITWIAVEGDQRIAEEPMTAAILRSLQFRVAITVESTALAKICSLWSDDIDRVESREIKDTLRAMRTMSIGVGQGEIPYSLRLEALQHIDEIPEEFRKFPKLPPGFVGSDSETPTLRQIVHVASIKSVNCFENLSHLASWLEVGATATDRADFEAIIEWPIIQSMGAFVHTAWSANHEEIEDWVPWLNLFERIELYAQNFNSHRFGREAAKARALVLTEYLERSSDALAVLDRATEIFGQSAVLMEQRANVLFQIRDDESVLELWKRIRSEGAQTIVDDPFAFRRVAISAARLGRWRAAEEAFIEGSQVSKMTAGGLTRFGLLVDAALSSALDRRYSNAIGLLIDAVDAMPMQASEEGNVRWEAALRVASEVCRVIDKRSVSAGELKVQPGSASSPALASIKSEPGQEMREKLFRSEVYRLSACRCVGGRDTSKELEPLVNAKYSGIRWFATEARLGVALDSGAGEGFIRSLLDFDRSFAEVLRAKADGVSSLDQDSGPANSLPPNPERWRSLLFVGATCAGQQLVQNLGVWERDSSQLLGDAAALTSIVRELRESADGKAENLEQTVRDSSKSASIRVGAAVRLLFNSPTADLALQLQVFLLSAFADEAGIGSQGIWNTQIAFRFGTQWRALSKNGFQFISPRHSIPELLGAVRDVEIGKGTVMSVVSAAARAVRGKAIALPSRIL